MRIGINLLYLIPGIVGGTETYAAGLLHGLAQINNEDEFIVFVNREAAEWPLPHANNFRRVVCPIKATCRVKRYLYEQFMLPFLAKRYQLDLVHSLGYVAPVILPCKSVVSILDIIYDYPGSLFRKKLLRLLLHLSANTSTHILTISANSKNEIVNRLKVPKEKISITPLAPKIRHNTHGLRWHDLVKELGITGNYILALSSLSQSKNIPRLLEAYSTLGKKNIREVQLVLAGHVPRFGSSIFALVEQLKLGKHVIFAGYLPDDKLKLLLQHATAFVFPSLYEGFGIPILEAMEVGTPVACSKIASIPEVANDAALMFDPLRIDEIALAMKMLIVEADLREELVRKGYKNIARFSWEITAQKTLVVYFSLTRK